MEKLAQYRIRLMSVMEVKLMLWKTGKVKEENLRGVLYRKRGLQE